MRILINRFDHMVRWRISQLVTRLLELSPEPLVNILSYQPDVIYFTIE